MRCSLCGKPANLTVHKGAQLLNCCPDCYSADRADDPETGSKRSLWISCVWKDNINEEED